MQTVQFSATTLEGQNLLLGQPLSFVLKKSMDSPAHSLEVKFFRRQSCPRLHSIATDSLGQFYGIVDQQTASMSSRGVVLSIEARSQGGLLLDNEAAPQAYYNISLRDIFSRHIAPYGFRLEADYNPRLSAFVVGRGMAEWQVLAHFCAGALGRQPRMKGAATVSLMPLPNQEPMVLGTQRQRGQLPFIAVEDTFKRAGIPSLLMLKTDRNSYTAVEENPLAVQLLLQRTRYLSFSQEFGGQSGQDAAARIRAANLGLRLITVTLPGFPPVELGDSVELQSEVCNAQGMFVYALVRTLDKQGMTTKLTLADKRFA